MDKIPTFIKVSMIILVLYVGYAFIYSTCRKASAEDNLGERVFKANCSGCHLNGGNAIKPSKPVVGSLKIKSAEAFKAFLENPPAPMPKYKNITADSSQFSALHSYVQTLMSK